MRFRSQISLLVGVAFVLSSCGLTASADVTVPTRPSTPESSAAAALPSTAQGSPSASPSSSADLSTFYDQKVEWHNCGNADCATMIVPVDYTQPTGATVELAMARVKATGDKIGTLFVDPGGPGGSAVDYAKAADRIVSPAVREHYDIVGVDPRGVAHSDPVRCLTDAQTDDILSVDGTPDSPAEEEQTIEASAAVAEGCEKRGGQLFAHMGTVDAARDLDIARALVGDDTFSYLGKSYGTMLGSTYAELFPDRVGRMVLDGALPASLDLVEVTKGQADAFEVAVHNFAADCLTHSDCPFTGTEDQAVKQLQDWLASLDDKPLRSGDRLLNEPIAAYAVLSYLYFPSSDYPQLRGALTAAMKHQDAGPLLQLLDARIDRAPDGRYTSNGTDAFYAVTCLDRPFTGSVDDVKRYAKEWAATAPTFGPALAWGLLPCQGWPAGGDVITETNAKGSNPILVVSTTHDPATPYQWGQALAKELDNGHLITNDGYGHTGYMRGSQCLQSAVDTYLLKGDVPEDGTVCS
jgi:pimeloyl-ACP methyl ester carboxylesterase